MKKWFLILTFIILSCALEAKDYISFYANKAEMDKISELICEGVIPVNESGVAVLSPELSDSAFDNPVMIVKIHGDYAVLFITFNGGMLGDSKGVLHTIYPEDKVVHERKAVSARYRISNLKEITDTWYMCSASDG